MKLGLAVLPLEVWADVFLTPWFTRQELAQLLNGTRNRAFANKLDKLLHGCGKPTLRHLRITSQLKRESRRKRKKVPVQYSYKPLLAVAPRANLMEEIYQQCEFPECEMPENISGFKELTIRHLDDSVLDFLDKMRPLFTDVFLKIGSLPLQETETVRILLTHFLPQLGSIRAISGDNKCMELMEREFPGHLAQAKLFYLFNPRPAYIPAYLKWLNTPPPHGEHGPRLLSAYACSETILAILDVVHEQFLAATIPSPAAFVIFLKFYPQLYSDDDERHIPAKELTIENAATGEKLVVQNAVFNTSTGYDLPYVEVLRHPIGADANVREWINATAFNVGTNKEILILDPTIGRITKQAEHNNSDNHIQDKHANEQPSTSAQGK